MNPPDLSGDYLCMLVALQFFAMVMATALVIEIWLMVSRNLELAARPPSSSNAGRVDLESRS